MTNIEQLKTKGLFIELQTGLDQYAAPKDKDGKAIDLEVTKTKVYLAIDSLGIEANELMAEVGKLQRDGLLRSGLWNIINSIKSKLNSSTIGEEVDTSSNQSYSLPDAERSRIEARLRKEEEKNRRRIEAMKVKMEAAYAANLLKKSERLGLKAEEAIRIQELNKLIADSQSRKQALAQEKIQLDVGIKNWREEIAQLRPRRQLTNKVTKFNPAVMEKAVVDVMKFLSVNQRSTIKQIEEATGLENQLILAAKDVLIKQGKILPTTGRGPNAAYNLVA